jgi:hypothetical protein
MKVVPGMAGTNAGQECGNRGANSTQMAAPTQDKYGDGRLLVASCYGPPGAKSGISAIKRHFYLLLANCRDSIRV